MLVTSARCLGRRRLRLIAWWRCTREYLVDRWRPGAHRHAAVPCVTPLVKGGVLVVWPMTTMQVDWQDLQDRCSLRLERREEVGPHEDVVEVVVQHVQVVEDRRRLREVPSKVGRGLGH